MNIAAKYYYYLILDFYADSSSVNGTTQLSMFWVVVVGSRYIETINKTIHIGCGHTKSLQTGDLYREPR